MSKKQSLADKISSVLSTTPASFNPDENNDETLAKVTEGALEDDVDEVLLSKFRKKNVEILEEVDTKYAGRKGSRKNLQGSENEWETEEEMGSGAEGSERDVSDGDESAQSGIDEDGNSEGEYSDETDKGGENSDEDMEQDEIEEEDNFHHMNEDNIPNQVKKGLCVRNQLNIWETLLEMRIQMQKCLIAANKMPQKGCYKTILEESREEFKTKTNEAKATLNNTLSKLLELQTLVWKKYPETKTLLKATSKKEANAEENMESDEEIPSDTDADESEPQRDESDEENEHKSPRKRIKLSDIEKDLEERHKKYKNYRNSVIQKWNDKTRIGATKSNFQHSVLNQIEHILTDKQRLIKRTQTKRSNYEIIGLQDDVDQESEESKLPLESNVEIFDDDDFYHQLLRELIEVKSADVTDPVQLGRQWIQLQNLRSKMKRKVDTRATKGRKIRYTVHAKLVNFMAPIDEGTYTEEAKTELFSSLCGRSKPVYKL